MSTQQSQRAEGPGAEVGGAEAPSAAQRRAARQANQTPLNLVLALVASLGLVVFLVVVVIRPEVTPLPVDYRGVGANAQAVDDRFVVPNLPEEWTANRSELSCESSDGIACWSTGLLTPEGEFIAMVQGVDANESWIAGQVADARTVLGVRIDGRDWQIYDRRDVPDPGNHEYALVATVDELTIVLYGTASDAEFEVVATAISKELP